MSIFSDALTIYEREMLLFKANIRANIIRSIMFPVIIIVFFGNIGNTVSNVPVAVVNYANNPQSLSFISAIQAQSSITVTTVTTQQNALSMLDSGSVDLVIVILPNFPGHSISTPDIQVYYSGTQQADVQAALPTVDKAAAEYGTSVQSNVNSAYQVSGQPSSVSAAPVNAANGSYKDFITGGIIGMVVIFGALFGSGFSLITDRQLGNLKAFLITPINKNSIVMGKVLAGATQSLLYSFLALLVGFLDGVTFATGWLVIPYVAAVTIILGVGFNAVAIIIATKVTRVDIFAIVSQMIALPLWFISGGILPLSSLPGWLQAVAVANPITYVNDIVRAVILGGSFNLVSIVSWFAVITVFAVIMLFLSFKMFKSTIE